MQYKYFVGLGNFGTQYALNRHNAGLQFIDYWLQQSDQAKLIKRHSLYNIFKISHTINLVKLKTYMNLSGDAVKKLFEEEHVKKEYLYIVHDDMDILLGRHKIEFAHGPKGHNGLISIEQALGTVKFWRVRIGIESRLPEQDISGTEFALSNYLPEERATLNKTFNEIKDKLLKTL